MNIYYIHGFNSTARPDSPKVRDLISGLAHPVKCLSYDSADTFEHNITTMTQAINSEEPVFIGTSLGAFYAEHLASVHNGLAIMLNPSLMPNKSLSKHLGDNTAYGSTTPWTLTQHTIDSYPNNIGKADFHRMVVVSVDDEVIPPQPTIDFYKDIADVHIVTGIEHAYPRVNDPIIVNTMIEHINRIGITP